MNIHSVPRILKGLANGLVWEGPVGADERHMYLTFDDGPVPGPTEFVLDALASYNAKATFFAVGDNVRKHPDIARRIVAEGHTLANHTEHHVKGWDQPASIYLAEVAQCQDTLQTVTGQAPMLFRPPYGRITPVQVRALKAIGFQVVMWSVLSADYDASLSPGACLTNTYKLCKPGAIVVFHDSQKAAPRMEKVLPALLEVLHQEGYGFRGLG